jgi:NAD(P)H-dependent FMN reductase
VPSAVFEVFDLASYNMPFFDKAIAPWSNPSRTPVPGVASCLSDMASADGYVFLTPDYNFGAVLKNALDLLAHEADGTPAFIISYSGTYWGGIISRASAPADIEYARDACHAHEPTSGSCRHDVE